MNERQTLRIQCSPDSDGWRCTVVVGADPRATTHEVTVRAEELERLGRPEVSVERLVELSFDFLLEREPRESILLRFDLSAIGRYFPEYESSILMRPAR